MSMETTLHVTIDCNICRGHGRCYAFAPALFEPDDDGLPILLGDPATDDVRDDLELARTNCPEQAIIASRNTTHTLEQN